ncbi:MAG: hypothetical protein V3R89_08620 [Thermoanaerobaculia bacterium]
MRSHLTEEFRRLFGRLPSHVQQLARDSYSLWKDNPGHPGLQFKRVHPRKPIYSIRVGIGWRALGVREGDVVVWFWIGSHSAYDKLLKRL